MVNVAIRQRGVSMSGMLVAVVVVVLIAIGGIKIIPYYVEAKTIQAQFDEITHDPGLKTATVADIRLAFSRRATVADISSIKGEDIDISKDADGIYLSANYSVKVPLTGNASLLLEFHPGSGK